MLSNDDFHGKTPTKTLSFAQPGYTDSLNIFSSVRVSNLAWVLKESSALSHGLGL